MSARRTKQALEVDGRTLEVSNLEKVLYPVAGFRKADVIDYYIRVSRFLLPHLKNRPVTLKRYPDGVGGEHFYEKDAPKYTPDWVATYPVPRRTGGRPIRYILINDLATLVWCANLANLEIHPFLHRAPHIERPTDIVFDLDPGEGAEILRCAEVAFMLKELLERWGLQSFPKVSGSKGLQLYVPLNAAVSYDSTLPFAKALATYLAREHPELVVAEMTKAVRSGKVFIDWSQNSDFKTTVGFYSLRAKRQRPFVSLPVRWEELQSALDAGTHDGLYYQPAAALERLEATGDLFAPVLKLKQKLPRDFEDALDKPGVVRPKKRSAEVSAAALKTYSAKRSFEKTPEPAPTPRRASHQGGQRRFVVQKHAASHLHYDFRLEMHGALKSWAVPKGVPYALDEKRLAMATEDHPLAYLDFEGVIPEGQYGGGTVMVWDIGTYELVEGNYYKGNLHVFLTGSKLKGDWLLRKDAGSDKNWSLIKAGEGMRPISAKRDDSSALTGRTMREIAAARDREWQSNRAPKGPDLSALPPAEAVFVEPMQALLVAALPEGDAWEYEVKFDGYRALALKSAGRVRILSRRNHELSAHFPALPAGFEALEDGTIVDGEIVALDEQGRPCFNLLQNWASRKQPVHYYAFDLLAYRGKSLLELALRERRTVLREQVMPGLAEPVRFSETLQATPEALIGAAQEQGLEGLIAKRLSSTYKPGQRNGDWVKYRTSQGQELVIGGYKPGKRFFDSLLVGYYEGKELLFVGKLKNGFVPASREQVAARFPRLETEVCPFANLPEAKNARRGEALTAEAMRKYRWLKPELVAQVEFTDWTDANHLRHAKFAGLREDKNPREVHHERPGKLPDATRKPQRTSTTE